MISIVIPTKNRSYTLEKVLNSYYTQELVKEIIIVDDGGNDDTEEVIKEISENYKDIVTVYKKHPESLGAAAGRITGYKLASFDYVLFGEDDAFLGSDYTKVLFDKINKNNDLGLISGRIIYKLKGESNDESKKRFGFGFEKKPVFDFDYFSVNVNAVFKGDITLPLTHAIFLTRKSLLKKFGYDPFYGKGNGYREESDFQVNALIHGYQIKCTNDTHCFHMSRLDVTTGGQRINRFRQLYWNVI